MVDGFVYQQIDSMIAEEQVRCHSVHEKTKAWERHAAEDTGLTIEEIRRLRLACDNDELEGGA